MLNLPAGINRGNSIKTYIRYQKGMFVKNTARDSARTLWEGVKPVIGCKKSFVRFLQYFLLKLGCTRRFVGVTLDNDSIYKTLFQHSSVQILLIVITLQSQPLLLFI